MFQDISKQNAIAARQSVYSIWDIFDVSNGMKIYHLENIQNTEDNHTIEYSILRFIIEQAECEEPPRNYQAPYEAGGHSITMPSDFYGAFFML